VVSPILTTWWPRSVPAMSIDTPTPAATVDEGRPHAFLGDVARAAGSRFRLAERTPFNLVLEARP
jgi:hypothetical protein